MQQEAGSARAACPCANLAPHPSAAGTQPSSTPCHATPRHQQLPTAPAEFQTHATTQVTGLGVGSTPALPTQISHLTGGFGKGAPQPNGGLQRLSSEAKGNTHGQTVVGSDSLSTTPKRHSRGIQASLRSAGAAGAGVLPAQPGAKAGAPPAGTAAQLPPGNPAGALWTHPDRPRRVLAQGDLARPQHGRCCPAHAAAVYHPKAGTAVLLLRAKSELRGWAPAHGFHCHRLPPSSAPKSRLLPPHPLTQPPG